MMSVIRQIFIWFDVVVYGFVESIFQVIVDLANIQLFNDTVIDEFASRLYIILGLVMLFKIMISFVQMLINPDKMDDKEQGVTSLLKRVVISLALIVLVPSIFDLARQVQTELLPVIPKVVLGVESDLTLEDSEAMNSVGRVMSFYTFLAFFNYDNQDCDDGSIIATGSRLDIEHQFQQAATIVSVGTASEHVLDRCPASTDADGYRYKYNVLLSTIVGAYLLFVLVQIAVKIAIRTLKLGICEFVAPIPIASYIDPKMSKQTFDTWVNTCWKTYLDLFIRLIIVYFMIFVFQTVLTNEFSTALYGKLGGSWIRGSLVTLFIVVGVLQFAKEAPKFIGDMLGLKADGDLMGMFKGEGFKAFKDAAAIPGTVAAAVGSGIGNYRYARKNGVNAGASFFRGIGGFTGATKNGLVSAFKGEGWKGAYTNNIARTTSLSQRRVNAGAIARSSKEEREYELSKINKDIADYETQLQKAKSSGNTKLVDELTKKIEGKQREKQFVPNAIRPRIDGMKAAFNAWQGFTTPTGSSYSSAASSLAKLRSEYYTGEAMKKMNEKDGHLLDTVTHGYMDDSGNEFQANYTTMRQAYTEWQNGTYKGTINGHAISADKIESYFLDAQKSGAQDYLNAAIRGIKDSTGNMVHINNTAIDEMDKQVPGILDGLGIDDNTKKVLISEYQRNPGSFFKKLSDISKQLETTGSRRSAFEQNQEKK